MEAYTTNNEPRVIPDYFVSSAERLGGCPERLRADRGTENGHVEIKVDMTFQLYSRHFEFNVDVSILISSRQNIFFLRGALILRRSFGLQMTVKSPNLKIVNAPNTSTNL